MTIFHLNKTYVIENIFAWSAALGASLVALLPIVQFFAYIFACAVSIATFIKIIKDWSKVDKVIKDKQNDTNTNSR
jgi:hypothetical protein